MISFAEMSEYMPPTSGSESVLGWIVYIAIAIAAVSHVVKMWLPKPPMEEQLSRLEQRLIARLDKQDKDADNRIATLRAHIDTEVMRLHSRIDVHGQELFRLKGYVDGMNYRKEHAT